MKLKDNELEKRKTGRKKVNLEVFYTMDIHYLRKEIFRGELVNISEGIGGICIRGRIEFITGCNIILNFLLPNKKKIFTTGKITWTKEDTKSNYIAGINFDLDKEDMEYVLEQISGRDFVTGP